MSDLVYLNGELYHASDLSDDYLAHYGVVGMKWGKRKAAKRGKKYQYKSINTKFSERAYNKAKKTGKNVDQKKRLLDAHKRLDVKRQKHLEGRTGKQVGTSYALTALGGLGSPVGSLGTRTMQNTYRAGRAEGNGRARSAVSAGFGVTGRVINRELNARRAAGL